MSDVVAKCDNEKITKVKVASAEIIVSGKADKPYYEIKYYDLSKNEWCIGYGSYELKFVFQWLNECFELAKEPQECNSDLISRKKIIRDLFYSTDGNRYHTRDCDNFPITISLEDLRKVINNQPQVQQWIPCSERMPESKKGVLVNYKNGDFAVDFMHEDGKWFWEDEEEGLVVIAWQPLPEPYDNK